MLAKCFLFFIFLCVLYSVGQAANKVIVTTRFEESDVVHEQQCECVLFFQCENEIINLLPITYGNRSARTDVQCGENEVCCRRSYQFMDVFPSTSPSSNSLFPKGPDADNCVCVSPSRCVNSESQLSGAGTIDVRSSPCRLPEICCPPVSQKSSTHTTPKQHPQNLNFPTPSSIVLNPTGNDRWQPNSKCDILSIENDRLKNRIQKLEQDKGRRCEWLDGTNTSLPAGALSLFRFHDGDILYAGRAMHEKELLPAHVLHSTKLAYVINSGYVYAKPDYEVLCNCPNADWKSIERTKVPTDAIVFGYTYKNEKAYMGRTKHRGDVVFGRLQPEDRGMYIAVESKEVKLDESLYQFEVLVFN